MTPLFKKLNYKAQPIIRILNAPTSFASEPMPESAQVSSKVAAKDEILRFRRNEYVKCR